MLADFLTSNSRAEILRLLFSGNDEEFYLREIEKLSTIGLNSLQKEVKHLAKIDLILQRKNGNRIYYSANKEHPLYPELISIVEKTVGTVFLLRNKLMSQEIQCVFIFGSIAKNKDKALSDIDLVVIGNIKMRSLSKLLSGIQERIGREINPHIFTEIEFKNRINKKDHFVLSILKEKIKPVIGNLDDYR